MELTEQQKIRIVSPYIGCVDFVYEIENGFYNLPIPFNEVNCRCGHIGNESYYDIGTTRLLLTPLSKISYEDAIEVARLLNGNQNKAYHVQRENNRTDVWFGYECVHIYNDSTILYRQQGTEFIDIHVYRFLQSKGYDIPVFIEPNHHANNLTLIELGLAIDKTLNTEE